MNNTISSRIIKEFLDTVDFLILISGAIQVHVGVR